MTGKEVFITEVEGLVEHMSEEAVAFFNAWKEEKPSKAKAITENGIKILLYMQENSGQYNNIFKASEIAEGLATSGRSVSGSMRKLVTDGYVEKIGKDPVAYSITDKGRSFTLTD